MYRFVTALCLLCVTTLSAHSFTADCLYWSPLARSYDFAAIVSGQNEQFFTATASYHPGWRIKGRFDQECWFTEFSYLYLHTTDTAEVSRDADIVLGLQGLGPVRRIRAQLKHRYQNLNLRFGLFLHKRARGTLYAYANARYIKMDHKELSALASGAISIDITQRTEFKGGAFGVGLGSQYRLPCNFSLFAEVGPMAAIGRRRQPTQSSTIFGTPVGGSVMTPHTGVIPAIDLSLGIDYCWGVIQARVAYELNYYWNAIAMAPLAVGPTVPVVNEAFNQGYAGPYARLGVTF